MNNIYGGRLGKIIDKYPKVQCPICMTPQVQIINHLRGDVEWKCRHCKQRFTMPFNEDEDIVENKNGD